MAGLALGDAVRLHAEATSASGMQQSGKGVARFAVDEAAGRSDTQFALLSARTILRVGLRASADDFARSWIDDVVPKNLRFRGGRSEMAAICNLRRGLWPPQSADHEYAGSDGLARRIPPAGIASAGDPFTARRLAEADGAVSHHGEGIYAGVAVAVAVTMGIAGADVSTMYDEALAAVPSDSHTARSLVTARRLVESEGNSAGLTIAIRDTFGVPGRDRTRNAAEAVGRAFAALLHGHGDVAKSMLMAVDVGRDAGASAAIAGCISGAMCGISTFPAEWVEVLLPVCESRSGAMAGIHFIDIADQLVATPL